MMFQGVLLFLEKEKRSDAEMAGAGGGGGGLLTLALPSQDPKFAMPKDNLKGNWTGTFSELHFLKTRPIFYADPCP